LIFFYLGLLGGDPVKSKATLDVVKETEVLAGLLDGDHIHESSGVGGVSADLAVNLDEALLDDGGDLLLGEGVLQPVPQEDDEGQALAGLVGTSGRLGGPNSGELVQHPVAGGIQALQVLLGTTNLRTSDRDETETRGEINEQLHSIYQYLISQK